MSDSGFVLSGWTVNIHKPSPGGRSQKVEPGSRAQHRGRLLRQSSGLRCHSGAAAVRRTWAHHSKPGKTCVESWEEKSVSFQLQEEGFRFERNPRQHFQICFPLTEVKPNKDEMWRNINQPGRWEDPRVCRSEGDGPTVPLCSVWRCERSPSAVIHFYSPLTSVH